jgi:hypothetical protein
MTKLKEMNNGQFKKGHAKTGGRNKANLQRQTNQAPKAY